MQAIRWMGWWSRPSGPRAPLPFPTSWASISLRQLAPGAYLVRAHRQGYLTVRGTIVEVRPAVRTPSSFTLRREGEPSVPRVTEAGMGTTAIGAQPVPTDLVGERSETGLAWRLRQLKRSVLRDSDTAVDLPANDDFSFTDPFEYLGRAVETSARAAGALFADISLDGQVNLLTTGAFDNPPNCCRSIARAASRSSRLARPSATTATGTCAPR